MDVRMLGPFEVRVAGRAIAVPAGKARALLAALALRAGESVATGRLIEWLWGDDPPSSARNSLQVRIWELRRALEPAQAPHSNGSLLVSRASGYLLDVSPTAVDALVFERHVHDGHSALIKGRLHEAGAQLNAALALWRGDPLAELSDVPFASVELARLHELKTTAMEDRIEGDLRLGRHELVLGQLEALVREHPLRERLRGQLMRALYQTGRQADAFAVYDDARRTLAEELGIDPGPELQSVHRALLTHDPALQPRLEVRLPGRGTNLRPDPSSFVGRDPEIKRLQALLSTARLVTLTGPGGVGKTRLALEAARRALTGQPDGVWVVHLGSSRDAVALPERVATALGLRQGGVLVPGAAGEAITDDEERLLSHLRDRNLLLVLDSCEHVIDAVASFVADTLMRCPHVRLLCTSREPLRVPGEVVSRVRPLGVPASAHVSSEDALRHPAVRLFADRAAAAASDFRLDDSADVAAVVEICRRLDGLPLAIELAAAHVRALPMAQIAARLEDRFTFLADGPRTAVARQRTLKATLDWSWDLLSDTERNVLQRLAVFVGGVSLPAIEKVCASAHVAAEDVIRVIGRLVDQSLLSMTEEPRGHARYHLLETVRMYALERLSAAGEETVARRLHADVIGDQAPAAEREFRGERQAEWLERLRADYDNVRAALAWAIDQEDATRAYRIAGPLGWFWWLHGEHHRGKDRLESVLRLTGEVTPGERARALGWAAVLGLNEGEPRQALDRGEQAVRIYQQLGDHESAATVSLLLAVRLFTRGDHQHAREMVNAASPAAQAGGHPWALAATQLATASAELAAGRHGSARVAGEASLDRFREAGDRWGQVQSLDILGYTAEVRGDYALAVKLHGQALRLAQQLDLRQVVAYQLARLGNVATLQGDVPAARERYEQSLALSDELGNQAGLAYVRNGLGLLARRQGRHREARHYHRLALDWYRRSGSVAGKAFTCSCLGFAAELDDAYDEARVLHGRALRLAWETGDPRAVALALEGLAGAASGAGASLWAAELLGAASSLRQSVQAPLPAGERADCDRIEARLRESLAAADLTAALAKGRALAQRWGSAGEGVAPQPGDEVVSWCPVTSSF